MSAELSSLQSMLAQREEVFEEMQQRMNDETQSQSEMRNKQISEARGVGLVSHCSSRHMMTQPGKFRKACR
jgi:hypothetical protein